MSSDDSNIEADPELQSEAAPAAETVPLVEVPMEVATTVDDINVLLSFDLGQAEVTLSEIESWQVGAMVELDPALTAKNVKVTVRSNTQAIAEGDLVSIDDRMAVRINQTFFKA